MTTVTARMNKLGTWAGVFTFAALLTALPACGGEDEPTGAAGPVTLNPAEAVSGKADGFTSSQLPDVQCSDDPATADSQSWNHLKSYVIAALGSPRHRGIDLVAKASDDTQTLTGEISYGLTDKALEGEGVEVFACVAGSWNNLGAVNTDGEGRFSLKLTGDARLSLGQRDLFVSVVGDRSSVRFLGLVAPDDAQLAVSDVDGTLTSSENAFPESLVSGATVDPQPGAPDALAALNGLGYPLVYLTARGRFFTQDTRDWLAANGFPRGPLRLAPSLVTLPGSATVDYKSSSMSALGLPVVVGIGNRASDIEAYARVGVGPTSTFIKLPEFSSEVQSALDAGQAVGINDYSDLTAAFSSP